MQPNLNKAVEDDQTALVEAQQAEVAPNANQESSEKPIVVKGPLALIYSEALSVAFAKDKPFSEVSEKTDFQKLAMETAALDAQYLTKVVDYLKDDENKQITVFGIRPEDVQENTIGEVLDLFGENDQQKDEVYLVVDNTRGDVPMQPGEYRADLVNALEAMVVRMGGKFFTSLEELAAVVNNAAFTTIVEKYKSGDELNEHDLNPPATESDIAFYSGKLGFNLPVDLTAILKIHNGQENGAAPVFGEFGYFAGLEGALAWASDCARMVEEHTNDLPTVTVDPGIQPVWYCPGWIAVTDSVDGDAVCVDMHPAEGGVLGQVIYFSNKTNERKKLADSLSEWLATFAATMPVGQPQPEPAPAVQSAALEGTVETEGEKLKFSADGHKYTVTADDKEFVVEFQNGFPAKVGINGFTNEVMLAILIDRTKKLDQKMPCDENKAAIKAMEEALAAFDKRTENREKENKEGTDKA